MVLVFIPAAMACGTAAKLFDGGVEPSAVEKKNGGRGGDSSTVEKTKRGAGGEPSTVEASLRPFTLKRRPL